MPALIDNAFAVHAHARTLTLCSCFANKHLALMSPQQLDQYDCIINLPSNEWDIYYWITGKNDVPEEYDNDVMKMMQEFVQNEHKEERLRQPDLLATVTTSTQT